MKTLRTTIVKDYEFDVREVTFEKEYKDYTVTWYYENDIFEFLTMLNNKTKKECFILYNMSEKDAEDYIDTQINKPLDPKIEKYFEDKIKQIGRDLKSKNLPLRR